MTQAMTAMEALDYAPQWGSYVTAGDPGACMYGLDAKGKPADAYNRDLMVSHIDDVCLPIAVARAAEEPDPDSQDNDDDVELLGALKAYLVSLPMNAPHAYGEPAQVKGVDVEEFVESYIAAMLFSTTDESNEAGGDPMDDNYGISDIAPETMADIEADCRAFLEEVGEHITAENFKGRNSGGHVANAGHDFWLTRCGHGAGFWDGDWRGEEGRNEGPLSIAASKAGNLDPYIGDDGQVHI